MQVITQNEYLSPIHQTPKHNGQPVGTMRRHELYKICQSLNLPVSPDAPLTEMVKVYAMHEAVQKFQQMKQPEKTHE